MQANRSAPVLLLSPLVALALLGCSSSGDEQPDSGPPAPAEAGADEAGTKECLDDEACGACGTCTPEGDCAFADSRCDDGDPCTDDTCLGLEGCDNPPNTAPCDDGNPCTDNDRCVAGACVPGANACDCDKEQDCAEHEDADLCNGTLTCKGGKCEVDPATVVTCDTGGDSACKLNACQPATGKCSLQAAPEDTPCDDGDACSHSDSCKSGSCAGVTYVCDDDDPCTDDACAGDGSCAATPNTAPCDDAIYCNGADTCDGAGGCTVHAGDPCGGVQCNETSNSCGVPSLWYGLGGSEYCTWETGAEPGTISGGGISANSNTSFSSRLALTAGGAPVVAWLDRTATLASEIFIKRFDGTAWVELGAGSASGAGLSKIGTAGAPDLALTSKGQPVVAWAGGPEGKQEVFLKVFDGKAWNELDGSGSGGGVSKTAEASLNPSVVLDAQDNPAVAWQQSNKTGGSGAKIYVKTFDGSVWKDIGAGSTAGAGIISDAAKDAWSPELLLLAGQPMVIWLNRLIGQDNSVYAKLYDGAAWLEMGSGSAASLGISGAMSAGGLSLGLDPAGTPIAVWAGGSSGGDWQIYGKRYAGGEWLEIVPGTASGGGISGTSSTSLEPSLAFDSQGFPVVAFREGPQGNQQIYVVRRQGTKWVELTPGSASGGGVSNSANDSLRPSLAIRGGRACVSWEEKDAIGAPQILMRCTDLP